MKVLRIMRYVPAESPNLAKPYQEIKIPDFDSDFIFSSKNKDLIVLSSESISTLRFDRVVAVQYLEED